MFFYLILLKSKGCFCSVSSFDFKKNFSIAASLNCKFETFKCSGRDNWALLRKSSHRSARTVSCMYCNSCSFGQSGLIRHHWGPSTISQSYLPMCRSTTKVKIVSFGPFELLVALESSWAEEYSCIPGLSVIRRPVETSHIDQDMAHAPYRNNDFGSKHAPGLQMEAYTTGRRLYISSPSAIPSWKFFFQTKIESSCRSEHATLQTFGRYKGFFLYNYHE